MVGLSYLLGFGSEQPGHGSMAGSRSFANGGTVDVAWQGPYRWVERGEGGEAVVGGMVGVGVCGIGRRGEAGGADGLSRDLQEADRHRTRLAKLPSLMAHVCWSPVAKIGGHRVTRGRRKGGEGAAKGDFWRPLREPTRRPFRRKGGMGMSGAMAEKRKKKTGEKLGARCPPCR